jgi:hypothetical protein
MGPNLRGVTPNFIFIPRSVVIQFIHLIINFKKKVAGIALAIASATSLF